MPRGVVLKNYKTSASTVLVKDVSQDLHGFRPPRGVPKKKATASRPRYIPPLESSNAENYYYVKQLARETPVTVVFTDGEELSGMIGWYDGSCINLRCRDGYGRIIFKHSIRIIRKEGK